ncbi:MAG: hypothetical protein NUV60_02520 [Patescibacteria group bacterium]|nr:hypothetical protein [Patescibacteria group bacterium]
MKLNAVRKRMVETRGKVDVGHTDQLIKKVSVTVTPNYAAWLAKEKGRDVRIMQTAGMGALSSHGDGKFAVQTLISTSFAVVQNLVEAGVPEEVAYKLLPHEVYLLLPKSA